MTDEKFLLEVNVNDASGSADVDVSLLAAVMDSAYRARRKKPAAADLLVVTDGEIARLNRRHLGLDAPTDVLAFEDGDIEDGRLRLGDIAISADTARREAAERGVPFNHELAFYALHGLFHLLGMDDGDDGERAKMLAAQREAMREFGLEIGEGML